MKFVFSVISFLILPLFGLSQAEAVTQPVSYPSTWGTQCEGETYNCTDYYVYFDEAVSHTDDTLVGTGLKRLSCIDGVDPEAWLYSSVGDNLGVQELTTAEAVGSYNWLAVLTSTEPSVNTPEAYCGWNSFWRWDGSVWTAELGTGFNSFVSSLGSYPPLILNLRVYAYDNIDFDGRYGLGAYTAGQVVWDSNGAVTEQPVGSDIDDVVTCKTLDIFCQAQKKFYAILNFFFGVDTSSLVSNIESIESNVNSKAPFAYVNAVFGMDFSDVATSDVVPTFSIPIVHTAGVSSDIPNTLDWNDTEQNNTVKNTAGSFILTFKILLWLSFMFYLFTLSRRVI